MKNDPLGAGARWLSRSGIQHRTRDSKLNGGVAAWYEQDKKLYPFLYSEITGYALSAWIFLNKVRKTKQFLKNAHRAARWLTRHASAIGGGVKTRLYLVRHYVSPNYCFHQGRVYAFDTAMVGYGMLQLYRETRRPEYRQFSERLFGFLKDKMKRKDGLFHAYYDSKSGRVGEDLEKWSDQAGSFHGKLALFFIDHYRLTRRAESLALTTDLLDRVLSQQKPDGRFITGKADQSTHLHPHAYTLEGLVYAGVRLHEPKYLRAARKGFEWMLNGVSDDGSVSSHYVEGGFSHHERSDIVAQTLRLGAIFFCLDRKKEKKLLPVLERIQKHLLMFQRSDRSVQGGGFVYGAATDGLQRPHLNAWATMFALQALWMHERFVVNQRPLTIENFI